jgi:hypothetical protein
MARKHTPATASEVRAWAVAQGLIPATQDRGRLHPDVFNAFNEGKPKGAQYVVGHKEPKVVEVKVATKDARGRNRTAKVKVNPAEARAYGKANGLPVGERGVVPGPVLQAFAASTLG